MTQEELESTYNQYVAAKAAVQELREKLKEEYSSIFGGDSWESWAVWVHPQYLELAKAHEGHYGVSWDDIEEELGKELPPWAYFY